ncbi:unnamed protein product, partial [Dovyalis caffra]
QLFSIKSKMDKFIDTIRSKLTSQEEAQKRIEAKFDQIIKNHSSYIHNLEVQVGQLANALLTRNLENFPSNTKSNPKE